MTNDGYFPTQKDHLHLLEGLPNKDGTNLEFHSNRISSKFRIRIKYRIEYEYSVASNSIRIVNGVEMSCRNAASSRGHVHESVSEARFDSPSRFRNKAFCDQ